MTKLQMNNYSENNITIAFSHISNSDKQVFKLHTIVKDDQKLMNYIQRNVAGIDSVYNNSGQYSYSIYIGKSFDETKIIQHVAHLVTKYLNETLHILPSVKIVWKDKTKATIGEDGLLVDYEPFTPLNDEKVHDRSVAMVSSGRTMSKPALAQVLSNSRKVAEVAAKTCCGAEKFLDDKGLRNVGVIDRSLLVVGHSEYSGDNGLIKLMEDYAKVVVGERENNPIHDLDVITSGIPEKHRQLARAHQAIKNGTEEEKNTEISKLLVQTIYRANDEVADELDKVKEMLEGGAMFCQDSPAYRRFIMCVDRLRSVARKVE